MACPFVANAAQPSHPFSSRPANHSISSPASLSRDCPFSGRIGENSTRPSAAYITLPTDPSPVIDSVSLLRPHPTAVFFTSSGGPRLPDALPAGPQPSRLPSSYPLLPPTAALHSALHSFQALTSAYAYEAYADAFNWSELELGLETEGTW